MKRLLLAAIIAALIIEGLWIIVVPGDMVQKQVLNSLQRSGLEVEIADLRKGLFYNFSADRVTVGKSGHELFSVEGLSGRIDLLSLLSLRMTTRFHGTLSGGKVRGNVTLAGGKTEVEIIVDGADVKGIPFFHVVGLEGKGLLSGELKMRNGAGDIRFNVKDAQFAHVAFGGVTVPLDLFPRAMGALSVQGRNIRVTSFTLDGEGIYARISGDIAGDMMNLSMELMPDRSFSEKVVLFTLLGNYEVSPGHYVIPVQKRIPL